MSRLRQVGLDFVREAPVALVVSGEVAASPDRVYGALADDPSTWTWYPSLTNGRFPTSERGVGAPREVVVFGSTISETVLAAEPGRRWTYRVDTMRVPIAKALVEDWVLEELPSTSTREVATRVACTFALEPSALTARVAGPTGGVIAAVFAKALRNLDRRLAGSATP